MDLNFISSLCYASEAWKNIPLTYKSLSGKEKSVQVPLILTGFNGVYVVCEGIKDMPEIYQSIQHKLGIKNGLFSFAWREGEEAGVLYDPSRQLFVEIANFADGFENFYMNHLIPQAELHLYDFGKLEDYLVEQTLEVEEIPKPEEKTEKYIRPLITEDKLDKIADILLQMEDAGFVEGDYLIDPDGSMKVKKKISTTNGLGLLSNGCSEHLFLCEEEDGNKAYLTTVLGGWFGLHKFKRSKWGQGLLYLLTCGVGGVFYTYDLIMMLMGNYYDTKVEYAMEEGHIIQKKQRIYSRPVKNKKKWAVTVPAALLLTWALATFVYIPVAQGISQAISTIVQEVAENNLSDTLEIGVN